MEGRGQHHGKRGLDTGLPICKMGVQNVKMPVAARLTEPGPRALPATKHGEGPCKDARSFALLRQLFLLPLWIPAGFGVEKICASPVGPEGQEEP